MLFLKTRFLRTLGSRRIRTDISVTNMASNGWEEYEDSQKEEIKDEFGEADNHFKKMCLKKRTAE